MLSTWFNAAFVICNILGKPRVSPCLLARPLATSKRLPRRQWNIIVCQQLLTFAWTEYSPYITWWTSHTRLGRIRVGGEGGGLSYYRFRLTRAVRPRYRRFQKPRLPLTLVANIDSLSFRDKVELAFTHRVTNRDHTKTTESNVYTAKGSISGGRIHGASWRLFC